MDSQKTYAHECMVCKNVDKARMSFHTVKEMMFGMGHNFDYMLCKTCGLLQICEIPKDISRYYPDTYYSFQKYNNLIARLKRYSRLQMYKNYLFDKHNPVGLFWNALHPFSKPVFLNLIMHFLGNDILDVGCGGGGLLDELVACGYSNRNLFGVDLFIDHDMTTEYGVSIKKGTIHDIDRKFKLIMLHHSFEHMEDELEVLKKIKDLLLPEGVCMIRIPVVNTAWELYQENWYQIDAPRHFYLHTEKSLRILAEQAGLRIEDIVYDSTASQFIASELYKKGISLKKQKAALLLREFNVKQLWEYGRKSGELNILHKGDQAIFLLEASV